MEVAVVGASVGRAARLCALTVGWNVIVGGAAMATALLTGSLSLIGFGINAVVDSSVSALLVWRFRATEAGEVERAERAEQLALRVAGAAFLLVALYLIVQATRALVRGAHPDPTLFGIAEAVASLAVLPPLAYNKYALSARLSSRALHADSLLTVSGAALAAVALTALLLDRALRWQWEDGAGALVVAAFLAWQASNALRRG